MQEEDAPIPLQSTPALDKQNCYLFTYVLFKNPGENDPIALFKMVSAHDDLDSLKADFVRALPTNEGCNMKWGEVGKWEVIRRPEGDTEATYDIIRLPGQEDDDFMGEKLTRDVVKEAKAEDLNDRAAIDQYKENVKMRKIQEKKIELRKKALKEIEAELDDPKSLASYAQLHWKRLTQKSMIAEQRQRLEEVQKALKDTLGELAVRRRIYPHYEDKWKNEIRRLQKIMMPKKEKENPVDNPQANIGTEDDDELAGINPEDPVDEFDQGIGVEAKGKEDESDFEVRLKKGETEVQKSEEAINNSFLPNEPIKKVIPKNGRKKSSKANYRKGKK